MSKPAKQTANTCFTTSGPRRVVTPPAVAPPRRRAPACAVRANETRRGMRQGKQQRSVRHPPAPFSGVLGWVDEASPQCLKRLSATDISALASMKNVAKCDTWCELQNPVNHRVFERKLRPKPLGRGHVCLGVTHRVAPLHRSHERALGGGDWPPVRVSARPAQM